MLTFSGYMALCPAHEDRTPSLSISDGDGGHVLLHCFAGCNTADVLAAKGLTMADLMPSQPERTLGGLGPVEVSYPYTDEQDKVLYEVQRYAKKAFRQRRPDARGGWIWNMRGVRRVLFRLSKVLDAKVRGDIIFVVEGEKDALVLVSHGFCATCNVGGAGKWLPAYTETLTGACVVVIADKDDPGRKHASAVANALHGKATAVRVLELPDRNGVRVKDTADWFGAGGTREELDRIVANTAAFHPGDDCTGTVVCSEASVDEVAERIIPLPSDATTITESATIIYRLTGVDKGMFFRGGRVVELVSDGRETCLDIVNPDGFRSRVEKLGVVGTWVKGKGEKRVFSPKRAGKDCANALLAAKEAREFLPPIASVVNAPVIALSDGQAKRFGVGYHREIGGGIYVGGTLTADTRLPVSDAAALLEAVLVDFQFATPSDKMRALALLLTPALVFGGFLCGPAPLGIAEADQSQTGKDYFCAVVCAIYNEEASLVAQRNGGVGGFDESLQERYVQGKPFVHISNLRGDINSPFFEAALTAEGSIGCRIPHKGEIHVNPRRFVVFATSNGFKSTTDLANRSCIVRLRKRPAGYHFKEWPEGDLLSHIKANCGLYLSAVHTLIEVWHEAGAISERDTGHDFRNWAGVIAGVLKIAWPDSPDMFEGHREAQLRTANPGLSWLRELALAVCEAGREGEEFSASTIAEFCDERGIDIPGLRDASDEEKAARAVGRIMARCLTGKSSVTVEAVTVALIESSYARPDGNGYRPCKRYVFSNGPAGGEPDTPPNPLNTPVQLRKSPLPVVSKTALRGLGGAVLNFEELKVALADFEVRFPCGPGELVPQCARSLPPEVTAAIRQHDDELRAWIGLSADGRQEATA